MLKFITALLFALCITTSYTQALNGEFVFQYEDEIYFPETELAASSASTYEEPSDDCMELVSKAMNLKTNELKDIEEEEGLMIVVNVDTQQVEGETIVSAYTVLDDSDEEGEIIVHVDASFVSKDVEGGSVISTFVDIEEESDDDDGEIVVTVDARFMNEEVDGETVISTSVSMDTDEEEEDEDLTIVVNVDTQQVEGETVVSAYTLPEDNDEEGEIIVHVDASFMKANVEGNNNSPNVDLLDS